VVALLDLQGRGCLRQALGRNGNLGDHSDVNRLGLVSAVLLAACTAAAAAGLADDIEVELVGFLDRLPEGGLRLPLSGQTVARLEVPNEQGGARVAFTVELTPRTEFSRGTGRVRGDQLLVMEGVLREDRLRVLRVSEVDVTEYSGRVSLREGSLALPVAADRVVEIFLDGTSSLPVTFLLTPRTISRQSSLLDGQRVTISVVSGRRLAVGIEALSSR
jgi:hypothetical protein